MDGAISADEIGAMLAEAQVRPTVRGSGTLFGEPVLAFVQVPTADHEGFRYAYATPDGRVVAWASEAVGRGPSADEASWGEMVDHMKTEVVTVTDPAGARLLVVRHTKHVKTRATVADTYGREVGTIRQKNVLSRPRFDIAAGGQLYGRFKADSSRMLGFDIADAAGTTCGRLTKTGSPLYGVRAGVAPMATTMKVPSSFVLQLFQRPAQPLLTLAIPLVLDLSMSMASPAVTLTKRGPLHPD